MEEKGDSQYQEILKQLLALGATDELYKTAQEQRKYYCDYREMYYETQNLLKKVQTERDALEQRVNVMKAAIRIKNNILERQKNDLKHQIDGKECFQRMCEELLRRLGQKDDMKSPEE